MNIDEIQPDILAKWIDEHGCIGRVERKWAWWLNEDGSKGLSPVHGTRYLYRGQNRRYWSVTPTILRGIVTRATTIRELETPEQWRTLTALIRADWYCEILKTHPVLQWAAEQKFAIDRMALAQHYELPTGYIDLTESIEVALFFACCQFCDGKWQAKNSGKGILYRLDWVATQENLGPRIKAIGLQPFVRPHAQWAWTIEMMLGEDLEDFPGVEAVVFDHSRQIGDRLLDLFDGGESLLPSDPIYDWATHIKNSFELPRSNAYSVTHDIINDALGLAGHDAEQLLDQLETEIGVSLVETPPEPATAETMATLKSQWDRMRPGFTEEMEANTRLVVLRTPKDS